MRYFARVTGGLEQIAWQDISRRTAATLTAFGHRRIDFALAGAPGPLLDLRAVDDVYVYVARLDGFERTRADLSRLAHGLAALDFAPALKACAVVRPIARHPSYSVTASHLGKRNYSRYDLEETVHAALAPTVPWTFRPNRPAEPGEETQTSADLDLRLLMEDDWALLGLRLGQTPLHRRAYKVASQPGSLKAPVAYCLGLLADLRPGEIVLDPMCGAGTILIETASLLADGVILGGDIHAEAITATRQNLAAAGLAAHTLAEGAATEALGRREPGSISLFLYQADARTVRLPAQSIQAVISNPPWNLQVSTGTAVRAYYTAVLRNIERALAPAGRAVLLTAQAEDFRAALARIPSLHTKQTLPISLFGKHPTIFIVVKS